MEADPQERKSTGQPTSGRLEHSNRLRMALHALHGRNYSKALQLLDQELLPSVPKRLRVKALMLAGMVEEKQGRFRDAALVCRRAFDVGRDEPQSWFSPRLAEIRNHLKDFNVAEAETLAKSALEQCKQENQNWSKWLKQLDESPVNDFPVSVPLRPVRYSVAASKLGRLFLDLGYLSSAEKFLEEGISGNPRGGCRARQCLAELALRNRDYTLAIERCEEALILGKFQAKTISTWQIYISSLFRSGKREIDRKMWLGLTKSNPAIRARAILEIAKAASRFDGFSWNQPVAEWFEEESREYPLVRAEILKLFISLEKNKPSPDEAKLIRWANALLRTPRITPVERLSAHKRLLGCHLRLNQEEEARSLLQEVRQTLDGKRLAAVLHATALIARDFGREGQVRQMLHEILEIDGATKAQRGKARSALADFEQSMGRFSAAAPHFRDLAADTELPLRHRLQAGVRYYTCRWKTGETPDLDQVRRKLDPLLRQSDDLTVWLNFARHLNEVPPLQEYGHEILQEAEEKAFRTLEETADPGTSLEVLFLITRRWLYDFKDYGKIARQWEALSADQKEWLWTPSNRFWEFLWMVGTAYFRNFEFSKAEAVVVPYLQSPSTPDHGKQLLADGYAYWALVNKKKSLAMRQMNQAVLINPNSPHCANSLLFLALVCRDQGEAEKAREYASTLLRALNKRSTRSVQTWTRIGQARILLANGDLEAVRVQFPTYKNDELNQFQNELDYFTRLLTS